MNNHFRKIDSFALKTICLLFIALPLFSEICRAQIFQVGHRSEVFIDSSRGNRSIDAEVYYPADVAGDNVSFALSADTFPVLVFGHGFVMTWDAYMNIWEAVVPHGYIMVFPKTEGAISPSHEQFALDLAFLVREMHRLNGDNSGFYYQHVSSMDGVMGHSMGGGAAFLALASDSSIHSLITLAPAETNPSAISVAGNISQSALIFAGENDCVTPPVSNQIPMYDSLQSSCKSLLTIYGGSHCQMANSNFLCSIGESSCTPAPAISRADQHTAISRYLIPWLDYTLKSNCTAGADFESLLLSDTAVSVAKNCTLCNLTQIDPAKDMDFIISANPVTTDKFFISGIGNLETTLSVQLVSSIGEIMHYKSISTVGRSEIELSAANIRNGIYFLHFKIGSKSIVKRLVILH